MLESRLNCSPVGVHSNFPAGIPDVFSQEFLFPVFFFFWGGGAWSVGWGALYNTQTLGTQTVQYHCLFTYLAKHGATAL